MPKTKTQISFAVTAKLIRAFVFAIQIVQSLFYLNPKLQASSHLVWLYSPICVGPGRKPRRPVFSQRGSYGLHLRMAPGDQPSWDSEISFMETFLTLQLIQGDQVSLVVRKLVFGVFDQVPHKLGCTATEDS